MPSATVRIGPKAHKLLKSLTRLTGESMPAVLDKALETYRRRQFLIGLNADFAALRRDSRAWKKELEERAGWDATLVDGLEDR
jgi:hypothetical protein